MESISFEGSHNIKKNTSPITVWLSKTNTFWFTVFVSLTAFGLYTYMYAFRKPFSAATFETLSFLNVDYKVWLVTFQVCGYALSKFIGIKYVSELQANSRSKGIVIIILIAGVSWLLFGCLPAPINIVCLFFNGLSLGLGWGMVFGYLEGRKMTEVLGAALSVSFIFSSGLCRSVGAYLIVDWHVSENWMPFVAACIFAIPLGGFLFLLDKVPPPTKEDELLRTRRQPMHARDRKKFIYTFLPGIILFVLAYMLLTAFRDFRDNFSAEVWRDIGYGNSPGIYTATEAPVSLAVLTVMGSIILIKNNKFALMINHIIITAGMVLIGVSTLLFENQVISPVMWMTLSGLGLYLGYVPFNSIFFDRMIATFKYAGTVGFIMYVADAFGYLGSIGVLFFKQCTNETSGWLEFFISAGYAFSIAGALLILGSMLYFHLKYRNWTGR